MQEQTSNKQQDQQQSQQDYQYQNLPVLTWKLQSFYSFQDFQLQVNDLSSSMFKKELEVSNDYQFEQCIQMYHQTKQILMSQPNEQNTLSFYQAVINLSPLYPNMQQLRKCKKLFSVQIKSQQVYLENPSQEAACAFYNLCNQIAKDTQMKDIIKADKIGYYSKCALQCVENQQCPIYNQIELQNKIAQCLTIELQILYRMVGNDASAIIDIAVPSYSVQSSTQQQQIQGQEKLQYSQDQTLLSPPVQQSENNNNQDQQIQIPQIPQMPQIPQLPDFNINQNIVSQSTAQDVEKQEEQIQLPQELPQEELKELPKEELKENLKEEIQVDSKQEIKQEQPQQNKDPLIIDTLEEIQLILYNTDPILAIYEDLMQKNLLPSQLLNVYYFYKQLNLILILYSSNGDTYMITQIVQMLSKLIPNDLPLYQQIMIDFTPFLSQVDVDPQLKQLQTIHQLPKKNINLEILPVGFKDTLNYLYSEYQKQYQATLDKIQQDSMKLEQNHKIARQYMEQPQLQQLVQILQLETIDIEQSLTQLENAQIDLQNLLQMNQQAQQLYQGYQQLTQTDDKQVSQFGQRWNSGGIRARIIANANVLVQYAQTILNIIQEAQKNNLNGYKAIGNQLQDLIDKIDFDQLKQQIESIKQNFLQEYDKVSLESQQIGQQAYQNLVQTQTIEQVKAHILQNNLIPQLVLNKKQSAQQNSLAVFTSVTRNVQQQFQQYDEKLRQIYQGFYGQLLQVTQQIQQQYPVLAGQQIQQFLQSVQIAQKVTNKANDINELNKLKNDLDSVKASYQQQMQLQWPQFCQGAIIILQ